MHLGSWGAGEPGVSRRKQGTAASSLQKEMGNGMDTAPSRATLAGKGRVRPWQ